MSLAGAVVLCEGGAGEVVDPGWSDRQGQLNGTPSLVHVVASAAGAVAVPIQTPVDATTRHHDQ
jgi:hypothetical protein